MNSSYKIEGNKVLFETVKDGKSEWKLVGFTNVSQSIESTIPEELHELIDTETAINSMRLQHSTKFQAKVCGQTVWLMPDRTWNEVLNMLWISIHNSLQSYLECSEAAVRWFLDNTPEDYLIRNHVEKIYEVRFTSVETGDYRIKEVDPSFDIIENKMEKLIEDLKQKDYQILQIIESHDYRITSPDEDPKTSGRLFLYEREVLTEICSQVNCVFSMFIEDPKNKNKKLGILCKIKRETKIPELFAKHLIGVKGNAIKKWAERLGLDKIQVTPC